MGINFSDVQGGVVCRDVTPPLIGVRLTSTSPVSFNVRNLAAARDLHRQLPDMPMRLQRWINGAFLAEVISGVYIWQVTDYLVELKLVLVPRNGEQTDDVLVRSVNTLCDGAGQNPVAYLGMDDAAMKCLIAQAFHTLLTLR